jgi:hypothetical protein
MKYLPIFFLLLGLTGCASVEQKKIAQENRCQELQDPKAKEACMDQVQTSQAAPERTWRDFGGRNR